MYIFYRLGMLFLNDFHGTCQDILIIFPEEKNLHEDFPWCMVAHRHRARSAMPPIASRLPRCGSSLDAVRSPAEAPQYATCLPMLRMELTFLKRVRRKKGVNCANQFKWFRGIIVSPTT